MSNRPNYRKRRPTELGGRIAGPGGPQDRNGVVLDLTDAVLLDSTVVTLVEGRRTGGDVPGEPLVALELTGRVNKSTDRADVLFLMDADGAAAIVTELLGLAGRAETFDSELMDRIRTRLEELPR